MVDTLKVEPPKTVSILDLTAMEPSMTSASTPEPDSAGSSVLVRGGKGHCARCWTRVVAAGLCRPVWLRMSTKGRLTGPLHQAWGVALMGAR